MILRPPEDDDLPWLVELARTEAEELRQPFATTARDIANGWTAPGQDRDRFHRVADRGGEIVGSCDLWLEGDVVFVSGYVAPGARRNGIGAAMRAWAEATIPTIGGIAAVHLGVRAGQAAGERFVASLDGFSYERSFLRMRNAEPHLVAKPGWGDGLESYRPADVVAEAVMLRNAAFVDHWGFHPWTEDEIRYRIDVEGRDPSLWQFASLDGQPAGVCLTSLVRAEEAISGTLGPIGTTRAARGRGVARTLLRHAIAELVSRGATSVTLWVDSANPFEATRLYEAHGFVVGDEWRVFRRPL